MYKKLFYLLLSSLLTVILLTSCSNEGNGLWFNGLNDNKTILADNTVILEEELANIITSFDQESGVITFDHLTSDLTGLNVGDILISPPTEAAPNGFLRKVESIENGIKFNTSQSTLEDAFKKLHISHTQELTLDDLNEEPDCAKGVTFNRENSSRGEFNFNLEYEIENNNGEKITVSGSVTIEPEFEFDLDLDFFTLEKLLFQNTSTITREITITSEQGIDFLDKTIPIASMNFTPIFINGVIITPVLEFDLNGKASISTSVTLGAEQKSIFTTGIAYNNGEWDYIAEKEILFPSFIAPGLSLNGSAKVGVMSKIGLNLYGLTTSYIGIEGYLKGDFVIDEDPLTPLWKLTGGIGCGVGVKVEVLGETITDKYKPDIISYSQVIAQADTDNGKISGHISDYSTGEPLGFVYIRVTNGVDLIATSVSEQNGSYEVITPEGSGYFVEFSKDGYIEKVVNNISVFTNETTEIDTQLIPAEGGTIEGNVLDSQSNNGLPNVNVEISLNQAVYTTTTNQDGNFSIVVPEGEGYQAHFSKVGYITEVYYNIDVESNLITQIEPILQIDNSYFGEGNIAGTIRNALNNSVVSGVSLKLRKGINSTSGEFIASTTTGESGNYLFENIEAGNYTIEASKDSYIDLYFSVISLGGETTENQDGSITPILLEDEIRIVLTWGESPSDLDSHLIGPTGDGSSEFHIYFDYKTYSYDGEVYAQLDLDDISAFGPETITIYHQTSGVYKYIVHNYSGSPSITESGAQVKVYKGSNLIETYNVPTNGSGRFWNVFELEGENITPINTITDSRDKFHNIIENLNKSRRE
ncbi:MAG: hypothetical protein CR982_02530 [Candidatus Cloacimonadota bacterium]|nr:MAG: hypothetical protein CR982_02530 [Candidatus Cloacimonadota bacterium]PIE78521.1 MAG: hypothetical protein CSA15_07450 [Candidatus Delongbacteria bacterium]